MPTTPGRPALGALYQRNGLTLALALAAALALFLVLGAALNGRAVGAPVDGGFYAIFPHNLMVALFAPVFVFAVLALGTRRRALLARSDARQSEPATAPALGEAAHNALRLKYLDGGHGEGCNNDRRRLDATRAAATTTSTFYGFLLCFAATSVATLYHYVLRLGGAVPVRLQLDRPAQAAGHRGRRGPGGRHRAGLWRLNRRRDPQHGDAAQKPMDLGFIALLFLTAATGLALPLLRATPALPLLLCLHLGAVMALFATLPYGKFAHGIYRSAALLKWAIERRLPTRLRLGSE